MSARTIRFVCGMALHVYAGFSLSWEPNRREVRSPGIRNENRFSASKPKFCNETVRSIRLDLEEISVQSAYSQLQSLLRRLDGPA